MYMRKLVGRNFARLRRAKGLTQEEIEARSGFSQQYLSSLERGRRNPTVITLYELAQALGVSHIELSSRTRIPHLYSHFSVAAARKFSRPSGLFCAAAWARSLGLICETDFKFCVLASTPSRRVNSPRAQTTRKPRPVVPDGAFRRSGSVPVLLATTRPDEGEGFAAFVVEEVGVDRSREAWIVELDREIVATLAGAPGPMPRLT